MGTAQIDKATALSVLDLIDEMIERQRHRLLALAQRKRPELTEAELPMLRDLPDICSDPAWRYEDGQLAGLLAARMLLMARLVGESKGGPS
jgi:hypothetical protein